VGGVPDEPPPQADKKAAAAKLIAVSGNLEPGSLMVVPSCVSGNAGIAGMFEEVLDAFWIKRMRCLK
jgi:hypothetical protein